MMNKMDKINHFLVRPLIVVAVLAIFVFHFGCAGEETTIEARQLAVLEAAETQVVENATAMARNAATAANSESLNATATVFQATGIAAWATYEANQPIPTLDAVGEFPLPPEPPLPFDVNIALEEDWLNLNAYIGSTTGTTCRIGSVTAAAVTEYIATNGNVLTLEDLLPVRNFTTTTIICLTPFTVQPPR